MLGHVVGGAGEGGGDGAGQGDIIQGSGIGGPTVQELYMSHHRLHDGGSGRV